MNGYPGEKEDVSRNKNFQFYTGEIQSTPQGDYIDTIHTKWWGNFDMLESHHGYIQWLFPIREQGLNYAAHKLMKHEIESLTDPNVYTEFKKRLIYSYRLMLHFYGMDLLISENGIATIKRTDQFVYQYDNLNRSFHNYLRITRILKCLGEFNLQAYQAPFVKFILSEIFENGDLKNTLKSCVGYWGKVIRDLEDRKAVYLVANGYFISDQKNKGNIVRKALYRAF